MTMDVLNVLAVRIALALIVLSCDIIIAKLSYVKTCDLPSVKRLSGSLSILIHVILSL
jgi:hypothetical protein